MASTIKNLYSGQAVTATTATIYTAPAAAGSSVVVKSLIAVNTHASSAVTLNLFYAPNSTASPTRIIPKDLSLAVSNSMVFTPMLTLGPSDKINGYASVSGCMDITISGVEIS